MGPRSATILLAGVLLLTTAASSAANAVGDTCDPAVTGSCGSSLTCEGTTCRAKQAGDNCDSTVTGSCGSTLTCEGTTCRAKRAGDLCDSTATDPCGTGTSLKCDKNTCKTSVGYDVACDASKVCTANNTVCSTSTNKCACKSGLKWDTTACIAKKPGDACVKADTTSCGSSLKCNASDLCEAKVADDVCVSTDMTSCGPSLKCINNACQAKAVGDDCLSADSCGPLLKCSNDKKCQDKVAGDPCDSAVAGSCGTGTSLMCDSKTCKTSTAYNQPCGANSVCTAANTDCLGTTETKCLCKVGFKENSAKTACTPKEVGDSCTDATPCGTSLKCGSDQKCAAKAVGDNCELSVAGSCGSLLTCASSLCRAKQAHDPCTTPEDDTCGVTMVCMPGKPNYCKAKTVGDKCQDSDASQCSANMICTNGECACKEGFKNDGYGTCGTSCKSPYREQDGVCVAPKAGDECDTTKVCLSSMTCKNTKCACASGYKPDGLNCVPAAIGDTCADATSCGSSMTCGTDKKCACGTGLNNDGTGNCAATCAYGYKMESSGCAAIQVNSNCEIGEEYTQCGPQQKCVSSKCVCMEGFTAQSGQCKVPNNAAGRQEIAALPLVAVTLTAWLALLA